MEEPKYGYRVLLSVHVGGPEAEWDDVAKALRERVAALGPFEVDGLSFEIDLCAIDTAGED